MGAFKRTFSPHFGDHMSGHYIFFFCQKTVHDLWPKGYPMTTYNTEVARFVSK